MEQSRPTKRKREHEEDEKPMETTPTKENEETDRAAGYDALVDALPYVDAYNENDRALALQLIEEEMKSFQPIDYLAHLPPAPELNYGGSPMVRSEFARIAKREPMQPIDIRRYSLPGPAQNEKNDLQAWQEAVNNAESQLEHQGLRIANLGLLSEYGANSWLEHNRAIEISHKNMQTQLLATRQKIEDTNRRRKTEQLAAGEQLRGLEQKWVGHIYKNLEIESACLQVQQEIKDLNEGEKEVEGD